MKRILLSTVFALASFTLLGQANETYLDSITVKSCSCIAGITDTSDVQKLSLSMGLCRLEAATPYAAELNRDYNFDLTASEKHGEQLGRMIGLKMVTYCPDILLKITNLINRDGDDREVIYTRGKVTGIQENTFIEITVKEEESGRNTRFYWISYVESNLDLPENYRKLKGKEVELSYLQLEFFDPRISQYRLFNVIQSLETVGY